MEKLIAAQNKAIDDLNKQLASISRVDNSYSYDKSGAAEDKIYSEMTLHF